MKTNSRFSRNACVISDIIWCNKHLRHMVVIEIISSTFLCEIFSYSKIVLISGTKHGFIHLQYRPVVREFRIIVNESRKNLLFEKALQFLCLYKGPFETKPDMSGNSMRRNINKYFIVLIIFILWSFVKSKHRKKYIGCKTTAGSIGYWENQ